MEATRIQQQQADERAASVKYIEAQQDQLAAMSSAQAVNIGDKGVIPSLPPAAYVAPISGAEKARLASQEYCEQRAEKARQLPKMRAAADQAAKRLASVSAETEKTAAKLAALQADRDHLADNADARLLLTQKLELLGKDAYELGMGGIGRRSNVTALEAELNDALAAWAAARVEWCRAALPVIEAALKAAEDVVAWKAEEARTGKPWRGGMEKAAVEKKFGPISMTAFKKMG